MAMGDSSREPADPLWSAHDAVGRQSHLLQTVLDSLTHPFYVIDVKDHQVRLANRAAVEMHGSGAATCYALTHNREGPCDGPEHRCPIQLILETREPVVVEHIHHDRHGTPRHVEVHAFPIFDEENRVTRIIEYCVDVTEQKAQEQKRRWDLAVNMALAELADALIDPSSSIEEVADIVLDQARRLTGSEHGYVSSLDPETGDMVSHTLTRMMGAACGVEAARRDAVFHPLPDGRYPGLWGHVLNTHTGFYTRDPARHLASTGLPEGHIALRNFLAVPALVGDAVVGQIALANCERDYSDRDLDAITRIAKLYALAVQQRRVEMALRGSEERYALAQKAANIGSWDWNIVTGRLVWSERIEPMFGFTPGGFAGTYEAFLQSVHPEDRRFVVDSVNACVERGTDYRIEHRIVWPDGATRWVSETGDVVRNAEGEAIRMLGVVRDITGQKEAELEVRRLNEQLEQRVLERTTELTESNRQLREEMKRRKRLEREILEISEREQTRIGRELHDSLGQQLTGVAIMSKVLQQRLAQHSPEEAARAGEIAQLISEAIDQTRRLSRGLHPVSLTEEGLMSALQALGATTQRVFGIPCTFTCDEPVLIAESSTAVHLYRIAQEAVTNAIRHGRATWIRLELQTDGEHATLSIENDGRPFPKRLPANRGMGLQVMSYRAEVIGGILEVRRGPKGGTRVTCVFQAKRQGREEDNGNAAKYQERR